MTIARERIDRWPHRLERVAEASGGRLRRVFVLRETTSTQDAARRAGAAIGDVYVAARQTAGRGRFGRTWADTADAGVAFTFAAPRDTSQRLAIASALGVARAIERLRADDPGDVGIKWPNDVVVEGRKIAGVLVEQIETCALVGVGVNVAQSAWAPDLADRAVSLCQLGVDVPRIEVLETLLAEVPAALAMPDAALARAFAVRDVLTGTDGRFRRGDHVVEGRVVRIDPLGAITVATADAEVVLDAATCRRDDAPLHLG